jgi:hypothetical protein
MAHLNSVLGDTSGRRDRSRSRDRIESRGRSRSRGKKYSEPSAHPERHSRQTLHKELSEDEQELNAYKEALIDNENALKKLIKEIEEELSPERRKEEGARAPADQASHMYDKNKLEYLKNRLRDIQIQIANVPLLGTGIHPDILKLHTREHLKKGGGKRKTIRKRKASNRRRSSRK